MARREYQRAQQPQQPTRVNLNDRLASGLVGLWVPSQGPQNLVAQSRLFLPTGTQITRLGKAGVFAGTLGTDTGLASVGFGFALAIRTGAAGTQSTVLQRAASGVEWGFHAAHTDAAYAGAVYCGPGYSIIGKPTGAALANNTVYVVGAGASGGSGSVYLDGANTGNASGLGTPATAGSLAWGGAWAENPALIYLYVWNRRPTDAEFRDVAQNPWRIFSSPQRRQRYVTPTTPTLSLPTAFNITATTVTPRVTVTF